MNDKTGKCIFKYPKRMSFMKDDSIKDDDVMVLSFMRYDGVKDNDVLREFIGDELRFVNDIPIIDNDDSVISNYISIDPGDYIIKREDEKIKIYNNEGFKERFIVQ